MEDQLIVDLFFERSEKAISELANKYGKRCKALSVKILGSEEDAEECVNDAYLCLWNTIPPQRPDDLAAFVSKIVRNISLKRLRFDSAMRRSRRSGTGSSSQRMRQLYSAAAC